MRCRRLAMTRSFLVVVDRSSSCNIKRRKQRLARRATASSDSPAHFAAPPLNPAPRQHSINIVCAVCDVTSRFEIQFPVSTSSRVEVTGSCSRWLRAHVMSTAVSVTSRVRGALAIKKDLMAVFHIDDKWLMPSHRCDCTEDAIHCSTTGSSS